MSFSLFYLFFRSPPPVNSYATLKIDVGILEESESLFQIPAITFIFHIILINSAYHLWELFPAIYTLASRDGHEIDDYYQIIVVCMDVIYHNLLLFVSFKQAIACNEVYYKICEKAKELTREIEMVPKSFEEERVGLWIDLRQLTNLFEERSLELKLYGVSLSSRAIWRTIVVFAFARLLSFAWRQSL